MTFSIFFANIFQEVFQLKFFIHILPSPELHNQPIVIFFIPLLKQY
jgi:hypothetical protein